VLQSKLFSGNKTLRIGGKIIDLTTPKVMGILNITPDSFYDGGRYLYEKDILTQTERMITEGADIIDIGAYSSRPGAVDIPEEAEWLRLEKALQAIKTEFPHIIISVDTFRARIAQRAVEEGADIINDISAGQLDNEMLKTIAALKVPYIMMHMRGTPQSMTNLTSYENLIKEIIDYFHNLITDCNLLGITDVIIDPGFGFAKTISQNFELLNGLLHLKVLDKPILIGLSRKSMIWKTLHTSPENSLNGTTALHAVALLRGASILRVHDVKEAKETVRLISQLHPSP